MFCVYLRNSKKANKSRTQSVQKRMGNRLYKGGNCRALLEKTLDFILGALGNSKLLKMFK